MSSNAYDELSAQGVHDTAAGVDPQSILTPPGPLADLGNLQFPRQPVSFYVCFLLRYILTFGGIAQSAHKRPCRSPRRTPGGRGETSVGEPAGAAILTPCTG